MSGKSVSFFIVAVLLTVAVSAQKQKTRHTFALGPTEFLLDNKPFQMISGEMHPARIPFEYWRHRIQMAKAMGCNTISAYIFWNFHEPQEGVFDFENGNHNLAEFIRLVQEEEMWLIIRPGPYVCAEWEFGGIPPYLLRIPDIRVRCMDQRYIAAAERYMKELANVLKPFLVSNGGPILMMQIENEFGSYGNNREYLLKLKQIWEDNGINVPFFTGDGATTQMLEGGTLPGCAVGLDPGTSQKDFDLAAKINPGVPVFSSETYPGWLTHWGEQWARTDTSEILKDIRFLMNNHKSFNIYVIHGGTNFGYTAGANSGGKGYEPDITSYDYDAPVNEQGMATPKYLAIRKLLESYLPKGKYLPPVPAPVRSVDIPQINVSVFTSVWDNLPQPVISLQPKPFESYNQDYGFILYTTELTGQKSGKLVVTDLHDYATVFLNGTFIGSLNRREGINSIDLPETAGEHPSLDILVEGMGRINFGKNLIDRKGITDSVTLNGTTLMNWKAFNLPLDDKFIYNLRSSARNPGKRGIFFRTTFYIVETGDTFFDLSGYTKGIVWINGHNLGRFWNIGPQKRLYCPAVWLRQGANEIMILDLLQTEAKPVFAYKTLE
jgi:beta-galactosidase